MARAIGLGTIILILGACDPIRVVSASEVISRPLDKECVVEALSMEETVQKADISDTGTIYARLSIPKDLESPESRPEVGVEELGHESGELELSLSMLWTGNRGSAEYREYVQGVLVDLRDRTIERCGTEAVNARKRVR